MKKTLIATLIAGATLVGCKSEETIRNEIEKMNIDVALKKYSSFHWGANVVKLQKGYTIKEYLDFDENGTVDEYKRYSKIGNSDIQAHHFVIEGAKPVMSTKYDSYIDKKLFEEFPSKEIRDSISKEMNGLEKLFSNANHELY